MPPCPPGFQLIDEDTKLPWFSDITAFPADLKLAPLAAQRTELYLGCSGAGRAYSIFDPSQLEQILVFANIPSRVGITSICFRGTEKMGQIAMGEWPDGVKINRRQKMNISGVKGERVVKVKVVFQRLEGEDRIVGLTIETNFGRSKAIVSSEMFPEKPIHLSAHNLKILECGEDDEIVGFHGVVSVSFILLLSLIADLSTLG